MRTTSDRRAALGSLAIVPLLVLVLAESFFSYPERSDGDARAAGSTAKPQSRIASQQIAVPPPRKVPPREQPVTSAPVELHIDVRDDQGDPVPEARVTVRAGKALLFQATDIEGHAVAELQQRGHADVHAVADGYEEASAEVEIAEDSARAALVLQRSGELTGHVVGYSGEPDNLSVLAVVAGEPGKLRSAVLSASGAFRFQALPAGTYVVGLQPAGFEAGSVEVTVLPGEHAEVELTLVRMGSLDVTAFLPSDIAASRQASLRLFRSREGIEFTRPLFLRSGVAERIAALPVGRYGVELTVTGLAQVPLQTVEVVPDRPQPLNFRWPEGRIAGRVSSSSGVATAAAVSAYKMVAGADDARVRDNNPEIKTYTKTDGSYVLSGLDAGHYVVIAQRDPFVAAADVDLSAAEDHTVDLTLESGRTIIARVRYRGRAVEGARVFATSMPYAENARSAETDARGLVRLQHLNGSAYNLRAVWIEGDDGPLRQARADVDLDADSGAVDLDLN
jgi:hypothetical protein